VLDCPSILFVAWNSNRTILPRLCLH